MQEKPHHNANRPTYSPAWADTPVQTKLTVNQPGDASEQEADALADQVMRMPEPQVQRCACGGDPGPDGECASCRAKRLSVQRKATRPGKTAGDAPHSIHQTLSRVGQPLAGGTRRSMESRFGTDFGDVRVHTDSQAAQSAQDVNARAYTVGSNIVFGSGQYMPGTISGDRLIAHELVHTMQQGNSGAMLQRTPETWYRGEAEGVPPARPGSVPHDFGDGLYLSDDPNVAGRYAETCAGSTPESGRVVRASFERSVLGRVLDLTENPRWASFLSRRMGSQTVEQLIRLANENYGRMFQAFLQENRLNLNDFDAIIGQEFVRGGNQLCIRNPEIQVQVRSMLSPVTAGSATRSTTAPETPNITDYNVRSQFRVLNSQELPGGRFVYEVDVTLGDGLDGLNAEIRTRGGRPLPQRLIVRLTTDADGALLAAESSTGEVNALIEGLARQLLRSAPAEAAGAGSGAAGAARGASRLVRGVVWAGVALFAAVSVYRMATTDDRAREGTMIAGGFVAGMGTTYLVCNLLLGIETLGWSLLLCGIPAGAVGGLAGEAAARVAYEEATIDDDEIRSWVGRQSTEALAAISTNERLRMIFSLMKGWVSDEDVSTIRRLLDTIRTRAEMSLIERFLRPQLIELSSIGQRTQIRVSLGRRIE